jgi:hypothetical protein
MGFQITATENRRIWFSHMGAADTADREEGETERLY